MLDRQSTIVIAPAGVNAITPAMLRPLRGSFGTGMDWRFVVIALLSVIAHVVFAWLLASSKVRPAEQVDLVKMPERFARLIVEKPIPKELAKPVAAAETQKASDKAAQLADETPESPQTKAPPTEAQRTQAKKTVAQRSVQVEQKMRTVGVLGMLTGVGTTAKGPSVVDVLGPTGTAKDKSIDLEKALANMQGLQKAGDAATAQQKLVKSKDITLRQTESIDHLVASLKTAGTGTLEKQGSFVIQKPESIEGAASSSAKRDDKAINKVVVAKRVGINLAYQEFLKRNPSLAGKVAIRFTITAAGEVINIVIVENTTGDSDFVAAVVRRIRYWRFEEIAEGEVTVTYPFVFHPS